MAALIFSMFAPLAPMTMPGFATFKVTVTRVLSLSKRRSMSMPDTPASLSFTAFLLLSSVNSRFLIMVRSFASDTRLSAKLFLSAYQRVLQSLMTPTRAPCGFTFWPIRKPPYFWSSTTVMWLVRLSIGEALPRLRAT